MEIKNGDMEENKPRYMKAYQAWSIIFFIDPLALPLAPVLARLKVNPNAITVIALIVGLLSGVLFAMGYWFWAPIAFLFSHFLDCIDGKVARLRQITSEFGAKLDDIADGLRKPSCFAGVFIYFCVNHHEIFALWTVIVFIVHFFTHKLYQLFGVLHSDLEFPDFHRKVIRRFAPRVLALYTFFEEFFFMFFVFPLVAYFVGMPQGAVFFLWGALFVSALTFLKLLILLNHRRKNRYEQVRQDWRGTKGNLDKTT